MILLHLALFLDRTEAAGEPARILGQGVFDLFCREMDGHFRETGVSDLKVPNEMRRKAEAFYGRLAAYRTALATPGTAALAQALLRKIYP
jgi:cytochrome b pre-mRNA-processing protein 3